MGIDTKIRIPKTDDTLQMVRDIEKTIKEKLPVFGDISVSHDHKAVKGDKFADYDGYRIHFALDYLAEQFESKKEQRSLWIYYDNYTTSEMLYLSLGAWGHSEDIAKCLVDIFGGYADFSDCDSILIDYAKPQPNP